LNKDATYWINKLNLKEHPEGGYFVETVVSDKTITSPEYDGTRSAFTAIYYLLVGEQFSSFHTMRSEELWHFCAGSTLTLHIIETDGELHEIRLGPNVDNGEKFQTAVKSGSWFAASVDDTTSYSLVGCIASPGFDYQDWRLGDAEALTKLYPRHKSTIEKYTRKSSHPNF
jgi:predicted cupin superfamily sugar epimerase